jgi:hypothetical protein
LIELLGADAVGLADAVTVVEDNVDWKLKTVAPPSPSGPPQGSPTAAVVPLPESATDVPKADEFGGVARTGPEDHELPAKL